MTVLYSWDPPALDAEVVRSPSLSVSHFFPYPSPQQEVEAYVMDATAIDAPFLLSKISDSPPPSGQQLQSAGPEITASSSSTPTKTLSSPAPERSGVIEVGDDSCRGSVSGPVEGSPAYDAVFTNAALHWVRAPRAVVDGARRVLRPGGRFVGEFGGHGNMAAVRVAMHSALWRRGVDPSTVDPWYFPTAEEYRTLLEEVRSNRTLLIEKFGRVGLVYNFVCVSLSVCFRTLFVCFFAWGVCM